MALSSNLTYYFIVLAVYMLLNVTSTPLPADTKFLVSNKTEGNGGYLPDGWDKFCTLKQESDEKVKVFFCHVKKQFSGKWNFNELREHVNNKTVKYKFEIKCEAESNISVPWPLKARNVLQLQVETCDLDHYLREYTQVSPSNFPDELEVLDIVDSVIIINIMDMLNIAINISEFNKDFDCGHEDTLKRYVFRNITFAFDTSIDLYLSTMFNNDLANMSDEVLITGSEMLPKSRHIKHKCIFNKLEYADFSINAKTTTFHIELSTENAMFPSLRFFNLSNSRLTNLAKAHRKWYRYFQKLEVMDLSHNLFTELEFDPTADVWDIPMLTLNVSYNNISEFKVDKLEELVDMKKLFIDFSHNPLNCSCSEETRQLITYVNDQSKWIQPKYQRYRFMMDLECMYPDDIYGKRLSDLNIEDLNCKLKKQSSDKVLMVNFTHYNITELQVDTLEKLIKEEGIFVNFSHNPLDCVCSQDMKELLVFIKEGERWTRPEYQRYKFLKEIECSYPTHLNGTALKDLQESQLICNFHRKLTKSTLSETVIPLTVISVLLLVFIVVMVRFRQEIRILLYTRFNVVLPCQQDETMEDKKIDSFVSYSNEDHE